MSFNLLVLHKFQFVLFTNNPINPNTVHSNKTYSAENMQLLPCFGVMKDIFSCPLTLYP